MGVIWDHHHMKKKKHHISYIDGNHQEQEIYTAQYSRGDKKSLRWNIYNLGVEVACGFVFDVVIVIDDQGWVLSLQSS